MQEIFRGTLINTEEVGILELMPGLATTKLQHLFDQQQGYLNYFFNTLDLQEVEKVVELCLKTKGLLIWTGVGKSGIIGEKIGATLMSTGTRALHLPAQNLLHGDMGAIGEGDTVFFLSKSGQTAELLEMVPHLKKKGCQLVAVVSEEGSPLGRFADLVVTLPVEKELCPFDLAPTTSTAVQLLFGDLLAMALMEEKGFSLEDYAGNHPSGAIGKRASVTVQELMRVGEELPLCGPEDLLVERIVDLSNKRCGCLLVVGERGELLGIFTDGDLRRALQRGGPSVLEKKVVELMSKDPITVQKEMRAQEALQLMQGDRYVMVCPVIKEERLIGLIRMHDIIHQGIPT